MVARAHVSRTISFAAAALIAAAAVGGYFRHGSPPGVAARSGVLRIDPAPVPLHPVAAKGLNSPSPPISAEDLLTSLAAEPALGEGTELMREALAAWTASNAGAATRWAVSHGRMNVLLAALCARGDYALAVMCADAANLAGSRRNELAVVVFNAWLAIAREAASAALAAWAADDVHRETGIAITQRWAERDGLAVAEFARSLPPGELRRAAFNVLASTWVPRDAAAAANWLVTLAPGAERDALAVAVASDPHWLVEHIDWSLATNQLIASDDARFNNLATVLRAWSARDAFAARAYVRQADLSDAQRVALFELLGEEHQGRGSG
jgi:hypothetical protein